MRLKKKLALALCFVFIFVSLFGGSAHLLAESKELSTSDIVRLYDNGVVVVEVYDKYNDLIALGSGFCIDKGLFATNHHVVFDRDAAYYRIYTNSGTSYAVEGIVKLDAKKDLAIIKTKEEADLPVVVPGTYKNAIKGDKVIAIGSPEGLQNTVSEGIVSGIRYVAEDDLTLVQITAPITHGSSGGPIFNKYGEVIGVAAAGIEGGGNLNFAVAIDHLTPWITELKAMQFSNIKVLQNPFGTSGQTGTQPGDTQQPPARPEEKEIIISNVKVNPIGDNTATISWTTNTPVTAILHYGTNSAYDKAINVSTAPSVNHIVTLTNLMPNTTYNYKILCTDYYNKQKYSDNLTFKTKEVITDSILSTIRSSFPKFKVTLDGSKFIGGNTAGMSYKWKLVSKPQQSNSSISTDSLLKPYFVPDVPGDYKISLVINNGVRNILRKEITYKVKTFNDSQDTFDAKLIEGNAAGYATGYNFEEMIPLTDGWAIIGDTNKNKIIIANILTGEVGKEYQLSAAPERLDFDFDSGIIVATQSASKRIVKIDLNNDEITYITMPEKVIDLVLGEKNSVFTYSYPSYRGQVSIIDLIQNKVIKSFTVDADFVGFMVYDKNSNNLILGVRGMSPSSLFRLSYDEYNMLLKESQELWDGGANGQHLAISNDGKHVAFSCGGGNGAGYTIYDIDSSDITSTFGEWKTGAYPSYADFSYDNKYLAATDGNEIQIFDVFTHVLLKTIPVKDGIHDLANTQFSRGGKLVYGYVDNKLYFFKTDL